MTTAQEIYRAFQDEGFDSVTQELTNNFIFGLESHLKDLLNDIIDNLFVPQLEDNTRMFVDRLAAHYKDLQNENYVATDFVHEKKQEIKYLIFDKLKISELREFIEDYTEYLNKELVIRLSEDDNL